MIEQPSINDVDNMEFLLTTKDNPFDPFEDWESWYNYDTLKGYDTCGYLARVIVTSPDLPLPSQRQAMRDAIDEIISFNLTDNYVLVSKHVDETNNNVESVDEGNE
jgi:hypothetical protein